MPGTSDTEFSLGQRYWCVGRKLSEPLLGTIIALTDAIGKPIGLEFEVDVGGHNCDGRGDLGKCLWTKPDQIYNETEWEDAVGVFSAQKAFTKQLVGNSYKQIAIDPATGQVYPEESIRGGTPAMQKVEDEKTPTKNLIHAASE